MATLLEFLAGRGCHGVLVMGTTGEGPSCSSAERETVMRAACAWREQSPEFSLLAGTGTASLDESIHLTRLAFDLGFDGVVVVPPYYFRKATEEGLLIWFSELMRRSVPRDGLLLGYHFPGTVGVGFSLDLLRRLKDAFPDQFAGLKDSGHDLEFSKNLGHTFGESLRIFSGTDSDFLAALEAGAVGCITAPANLLSRQLREIFDLFREGKDASGIQLDVAAKRHVLEAFLPFPPIMKALLHELHGLPRWPVKPPLDEGMEADIARASVELAPRG